MITLVIGGWPGLLHPDLAWWGLPLSDLAWWGNLEAVGSFGELPNPPLGAMAWPGILGGNRPAGGAKAGQYPTLTEKPPSTPWSTGLVEDLMAQTPMGRIQAHHLGLIREGNKTLKRVVVEARTTLPDPFWAAQEPLLAQARAMAKAAEKANLSGTKALEATLTQEYFSCLRYFLDQVFLNQALQREIAAEAAQLAAYAHVREFLVEAEAHAEHLRWRSHLGEYLLNPYVPWGFNGYEGDYLYVETCQVAQMEAERLYEAADLAQGTARLHGMAARSACRDSGRALSQADRTYWAEQAAVAAPENTPAPTSEPRSVHWQDPLVSEDQNGNPLASAPAIPEEDPYRAYFPAGGSVETSSFQDFFMESASDPLLMLIRGTLAYFGLG